ncbi:MAG TPA: CvpA family protein [Candidatus Obscuribacterales bacterium]
MVWDGLMVLLVITLAIAGWNVGIVNSWRGPFAMVVATIVTQKFYIDVATYIVGQLRMSPEYCIVLAYMLLWIGVEAFCEVVLMVLVQINKKTKPMFFERLFGAGFGLVKGVIILILPAIAVHAPLKVPTAPPDKSALINPMESGLDGSNLIPYLSGLGKGLYSGFGGLIASSKEPSFKPDFNGDDKPSSQ